MWESDNCDWQPISQIKYYLPNKSGLLQIDKKTNR